MMCTLIRTAMGVLLTLSLAHLEAVHVQHCFQELAAFVADPLHARLK